VANDTLFFDSSKVFVIAELSANHNNDLNTVMKTLRAMKDSGADAVKIQTYTVDTMTVDAKTKYFRIKGSAWDGRTLYDLYQEASLPWEWQPIIKKYAESIGLVFFSTPFDRSSADFLEQLEVPIYKIASFEINDIPLITHVARSGKPIILSTGVATKQEINDAIGACKSVGNNSIALLKCTSGYPAPYDEINLATIADMKNRFKTVVGISDHTLGWEIAVAAVASGARIVEKHFILNRKNGGPDAHFSIEPDEFGMMVKAIRNVEKAIGHVTYELTKSARDSRKYCRSLFAVKSIKRGEQFTNENVRSIRPGNGLPPRFITKVMGKRAARNIRFGTPLKWDMVV